MIYQVVARRVGVGRGFWHDRSHPATPDFVRARAHFLEVAHRYPRPTSVVILAGEDEWDLQAQIKAFINDRPARKADPSVDGVRKAIEFAPLRESYPLPRYLPRFENYSWRAETFLKLVRLMLRVHRGELGGAKDGAAVGGKERA